MSTTYINVELRRIVVARADGLCEYCLLHEDDTFFGCQIDHIVSEKHGGPTQSDNLAYACLFCNLYKGSDVGTFIPQTQTLVRFFNPRTDLWQEHFVIGAATGASTTAVLSGTMYQVYWVAHGRAFFFLGFHINSRTGSRGIPSCGRS